MANKKISELTTKSYLGDSDVAENSYILINYADAANDTPVTYKTTIHELGQAIANDLNLYMMSTSTEGHGGETVRIYADQGAYTQVVKDFATRDPYQPNAILYIYPSNDEYYVGNNTSAVSLAEAVAKSNYLDNASYYPFVVVDTSENTLHYRDSSGSLATIPITNNTLPEYAVSVDESNAGWLTYQDSSAQWHTLLSAPYVSGKFIVVANTNGDLYCYDTSAKEYVSVASLQNQ